MKNYIFAHQDIQSSSGLNVGFHFIGLLFLGFSLRKKCRKLRGKKSFSSMSGFRIIQKKFSFFQLILFQLNKIFNFKCI